MTAAARPLLLLLAVTGIGIAACSRHDQASDAGSLENRQLEIAPLKPAAPVASAEPAAPTAPPKPKPAVTNTVELATEPALPPDAQVQEDAAAVGMTSRTAAAGATAPPSERPSSMSNLY